MRLTERGQQAAQAGSEVIEGIEREWAAALGPDDMEELRSLLVRLVGVVGRQAERQAGQNTRSAQE